MLHMETADILELRNGMKSKNNEHFRKIDFRISRRPKSLPQVSDHAIDWERYIEKPKNPLYVAK